MLTHINSEHFTFEPYADRTKVLAEQKNVYKPENQSEMSTTEQKTPVGKLRRKKGVSVLLPPTKASDEFRRYVGQGDYFLRKIESLENEVAEKDILLKERKEHICDLGKRCEELEKENRKLKERMESKEFRNEVGQDYLRENMNILLKDSDKQAQDTRTKQYEVLRGLCEIPDIPEDVKERIRSLSFDMGKTTSMTVEGDFCQQKTIINRDYV